MSYLDLYIILSKVRLDVNDIMLVAGIGRNAALKIIKDIEREVIDSGNKLLYSKKKFIPTKRLVEYLKLDLDYIYVQAIREKNLKMNCLEEDKLCL